MSWRPLPSARSPHQRRGRACPRAPEHRSRACRRRLSRDALKPSSSPTKRLAPPKGARVRRAKLAGMSAEVWCVRPGRSGTANASSRSTGGAPDRRDPGRTAAARKPPAGLYERSPLDRRRAADGARTGTGCRGSRSLIDRRRPAPPIAVAFSSSSSASIADRRAMATTFMAGQSPMEAAIERPEWVEVRIEVDRRVGW